MTKKSKELILDYERRFKDSSFVLKLYTGWALVVLLLFGVIGMYKEVSDLVEKNNVIKEMVKLNNSLRAKLEVISTNKQKIDKNSEGVAFLNRYLPDDYGVEDYIVDFSFSAAEKGFRFKSFSQQNTGEVSNTLDAAAILEGPGNFGGLMSNIESLKRISQIKSIEVKKNLSDYDVNVLLNIYVMK